MNTTTRETALLEAARRVAEAKQDSDTAEMKWDTAFKVEQEARAAYEESLRHLQETKSKLAELAETKEET